MVETIQARTTGVELQQLARKIGMKDIPIVVLKSELNNVPKNTKNIIINLSSDPLHGTHWVAIRQNAKNYAYFDSFGIIYPNEVKQWVKKNKPLYYNNEEIQHYSEGFCGNYSLLWLYTQENDIDINTIFKVIRINDI